MKSLTITAQPKPEGGWVHRFRNFGEDVYVTLRASYEVNIAEIDAAFDEFHVCRIPENDVVSVARAVSALNFKHHLDDSVFIGVGDKPVHHQTVAIVLDTAMGERLWEIAGRHPIWVVGGELNRAAVEELWTTNEAHKADVTIWASEIELPTAQDWSGVLNTLEMHHDGYASVPPMNKLNVYGAIATQPVAEALRKFAFATVLPTASGFIALRDWRAA